MDRRVKPGDDREELERARRLPPLMPAEAGIQHDLQDWHERRKLYASDVYRENFLYFSRCGMTLSVPSRRILSAS